VPNSVSPETSILVAFGKIVSHLPQTTQSTKEHLHEGWMSPFGFETLTHKFYDGGWTDWIHLGDGKIT
jgi:hypothetical protein